MKETSHKRPGILWLLYLPGGLLLLALVILSLAGPVMLWPKADEANVLLDASYMARGLLPYKDFYEFLTPGSQWLGSLFIRLNGFSVVGLRMLVLSGWLIELGLLYAMGKKYLSPVWMGLFLAFFWLTASRYPVYQHHFWSGLAALTAVYFTWHYLQRVYQGQETRFFLALSGVFCGLTFWITESLGVIVSVAMGLFGLLHCFLHEREEKGISYHQVSNWEVLKRWGRTWGLFWMGPLLGVHVLCALVLMGLGIWNGFMRDAIIWLLEGHYKKGTVIGYFSTFNQEFLETIRPLVEGVSMPYLLLYLFRLPIAMHLFLIGLLPVVGILATGYLLPNRFVYRLLHREDEELLLFWVCGTAMIFSTMSYSTAMHITSNGSLVFLLGWLAFYRWLIKRGAMEKIMRIVTGIFCGLLLLGAVVGSSIQLIGGSWLPPFKNLPESLLFTEYPTTAKDVVEIVQLLEDAERQGRTVFVFAQSPSFYLAGTYRNATRFIWILPIYLSPKQMDEMLADLERNKPLYIVDDQSLPKLYHDERFKKLSREQLLLPPLQNYLKAHYVPQMALGRYIIYRRSGYFD